MNFLEKLIYALSGKMTTPTNYSWFHLMFIGIVLLTTVFLCLRYRDADRRQERRILLFFWGLIVLLEVYKELQFAMNYTEPIAENPITWSYEWGSFPFQFCSTPFYILPVAALARRERVRDAARCFLATFAFFAGIAVYVYPNDVFISTIGIDIQTMVHHGTQVILGAYLGMRLRREGKLTRPVFLRSCLIFVILVAVALTLNLAAPLFTDRTFNMFFIGPRFPCSLVILGEIYQRIPYLAFLALYVLGFSLVALLMLGIHRAFGLPGRRTARLSA